MSMRNRKPAAVAAICVVLGLSGINLASANPAPMQNQHKPKIDVVIALDVSDSMSGLIGSAKQRLWDIVNEFGRAQPQPELRISIVTFGNPDYGAESGFVRIDQAFTRNLDAVNQTLFSFATNGGDEYVARAISTAVDQLDWSTEPDALRILFVAGNESARQDPQISVLAATQMANAKGIVVNTIYCGDEDEGLSAGWQDVATMTNGLYASIDQNSAAVANIATPMDNRLTELNQALNDTYIAYGDIGEQSREQQLKQDANASRMSGATAASRVVTKAGKLYDNSEWDLVDAVGSGMTMDEFAAENLPASMQPMSAEERQEFVSEKADQRAALQAEIQDLDRGRRDYMEAEKKKLAADMPQGLDEVIQSGIRSMAEAKGFTFEDE